MGTIVDLLRDHAFARPQAPAVTFVQRDHAPTSLTFAELEHRVDVLARLLAARFSPGARALLLYPSGLEFVVAFLACLRARVVAVPSALPRRAKALERLRGLVSDATPEVILTIESALADIAASPVALPEALATELITPSMLDAHATLEAARGDDLAFLQYTSGSTGNPRGVMVTHANLMANEAVIQAGFGFTRNDVMVGWLPLFHDMGLVGNLLQAVYTGYHTVIIPPEDFLRDPLLWLRTLTHYRGTATGAPNFAWDLAARAGRAADLRGLDLSALEVAYNGAEPVRATTLETFARTFESCGFRPRALFPCYGLAEATLFVTGGPRGAGARTVSVSTPALSEGRFRPASAGEPSTVLVSSGVAWGDTDLAIAKADGQGLAERGEIGEIRVAGASITTGYWRGADHDVVTTIDGASSHTYLRTGDLGFVAEGHLYVTGRIKDLIIVRGRNLYPHDIERAVESRLHGIKPNGCAAFAIGGASTEGVGILIEAPERWCSESGVTDCPPSTYADIVAAIASEFGVGVGTVAVVRPGAFPRTTSGKVRRAAARALALSQADGVIQLAGASSHGGDGDFRELRSTVREVLEGWLAASGSPSVFAEDRTFGELGVDSVGVAEIAQELERRLRLPVDLETLQGDLTVAEIIRKLGRTRAVPRTEESGPTTPVAFKERWFAANERIERWRAQDRYFFNTTIDSQTSRTMTVAGRELLALSSYSYLGLLDHPKVVEACMRAASEFGTGPHAVRLLGGTTKLHIEFSAALADLVHAEDAIVFPSGYVTNHSTIAALVGPGDVVIGDALNHASIQDGCAASKAEFLQFRHGDLDHLEKCLQSAAGRATLVVTDAVFSMDGDIVDLPSVVRLCRNHGALLMVDEAHSIGVLGRTGRGVIEHFGLPWDAVDVKMGTLSKALASVGGFVAGSRALIDYLRHNARGFVFSGALPAPIVAAARAAIAVMLAEPERLRHLWSMRERYVHGLRAAGFEVGLSQTPIIPILCHSEQEALEMTHRLREAGFFVVPVFYPAVPKNEPRLRTCVLASHTAEDIDAAVRAIGLARNGLRGSSEGRAS